MKFFRFLDGKNVQQQRPAATAAAAVMAAAIAVAMVVAMAVEVAVEVAVEAAAVNVKRLQLLLVQAFVL